MKLARIQKVRGAVNRFRSRVVPAKPGLSLRPKRPSADNASAKNAYSQSGYTLVEMLVAMSIFAIVVVASTSLFVTVSGSSHKTTAQRRVQQDLRYNAEEITRDSRTSAIDYAFYATITDPTSNCHISKRRVLALIHTSEGPERSGTTRRLFYIYDAATKALYRYEPADTNTVRIPACTEIQAAVVAANRITNTKLEVTAASLIVSPLQNPVPSNSDFSTRNAWNYVHPRVTLVLRVATPNADSATGVTATNDTSAVQIETTVSVRAYPLDKLFGQPQ